MATKNDNCLGVHTHNTGGVWVTCPNVLCKNCESEKRTQEYVARTMAKWQIEGALDALEELKTEKDKYAREGIFLGIQTLLSQARDRLA